MFYLAYGSNLNMVQMEWRCPGAVPVTTAEIEGYRLIFKGSKTGAYLTIEPCEGSKVPVAVWKVNKDHVAALDRYEGYPTFYYKKDFLLKCADSRTRRCFVYIMDEKRSPGIPTRNYLSICREGYEDFDFDVTYLLDALKGGAA